MRPALFASAFHPHVGGVEELVRQLALEQQRQGTTPLVVTNRWPRDLPPDELVEGVPVDRPRMAFPGPSWRHWAGFVGRARQESAALNRRLVSHAVDLVHVQCVSSNGWYARRAARGLGVPLVVTMQGELTMDAEHVYERNPYLRRTWRRLLDDADAITACSGHALAEAEAAYGTSFGERATVVYNGISATEFEGVLPRAHPRPYVLGLGRMVRQKGFDVLIEAFEMSGASATHDLLLAGDGPELSALSAQVTRAGAAGRVHLLGRKTHADSLALFAGAAVFVLPSRQEPQGIVVLEAMASGSPVLAARVGGVPEVIDDEVNGLLYDGSASDLAARLDRLVLDRGLRDRLRTAGLEHSRRFAWSSITCQYEDRYAFARAAHASRFRA